MVIIRMTRPKMVNSLTTKLSTKLKSKFSLSLLYQILTLFSCTSIRAENDKHKASLRKKDEELATLKSALERFTNATTKNTLSEIEKRERRAMERKISEMEEELKVCPPVLLFHRAFRLIVTTSFCTHTNTNILTMFNITLVPFSVVHFYTF